MVDVLDEADFGLDPDPAERFGDIAFSIRLVYIIYNANNMNKFFLLLSLHVRINICFFFLRKKGNIM